MARWYCRECKTTRPEHQMLRGWNGVWCPNCVWNDVSPLVESGPGALPAGRSEAPGVEGGEAAAP